MNSPRTLHRAGRPGMRSGAALGEFGEAMKASPSVRAPRAPARRTGRHRGQNRLGAYNQQQVPRELSMPSMPAKEMTDRMFRTEGVRVVLQQAMAVIIDATNRIEIGQPLPSLALERYFGVPVPDRAWLEAEDLLSKLLSDLERKRDALEAATCTMNDASGTDADTPARSRKVAPSKAAARASKPNGRAIQKPLRDPIRDTGQAAA